MPRPFTLLGEVLEGDPLSERELEILAAVAAGETAAETGARLWLSSQTVRSHRKRILAKLGAKNAPHAVTLAIERDLLTARGSLSET